MLRAFPRTSEHGDQELRSAVWIDLVDPTEEERSAVQDAFGFTVPSVTSLKEIEATSRLKLVGDVLYLSVPLIAGTDTSRWTTAPTGFVLSPDKLLTVRFWKLPAFDTVIEEVSNEETLKPATIFVRLLEEVVDRAADHLERADEIIEEASHAIFFDDENRRALGRDNSHLRNAMRLIGRAGDKTSRVRYMFLTIGRMIAFIIDRCEALIDSDIRARFEAMRHDVVSLAEFESSLTGRIQLLQDAAAGFISIAQNDVVKVLTVASVIGVPPVLVVGIYGMNFKFMPELDWPFGYPFALALCVLSAVIPLVWLKWRHWF